MSASHAHPGGHGTHDVARDSALRTVEQHLEVVLSAVRVLPTTRVPLGEAFGRTLAEPVVSRVDIPVFDNSAMDGFAVRSADVAAAASDHPIRLRVVADLPAGTSLDPALAPGEAARIMTGSPVPADADAIVPFEDTAGGLHGTGDIVEVRAAAAAGAHVRRRGADSVAGTEIVSAGTLLGGFQVAAAAAAGVPDIAVHHTPRVAVVSTGSELAEPGGALERGQIPESNSLLLDGLVRGAGADVVLRATVADEVGELRAVLAEAVARGADVLITSGGVSAGAYEVVKDTFGPGGELQFTKVAMQPGKPQGFGVLEGGMLVFGLPGNPVSVAVSFETFVRPALLALQGRAQRQRDLLRLPAAVAWRTPPGRRQYLPAAIDRSDPARWTVRPATAGGSGSHLAGGLAVAEAFAVVPADAPAVAVGDLVDVMLIP
ncbi:Molybdopterin molybdenumtransferase 2 [Microbacterium lemovicicum]|uniref:Molybdopterin molybdenumtransferase n=1 Tax=Microbacterium lemovicicum TaxID=1072463 RepID=A0A3Q9J0Y1_9MICO|nr:gephyrin-like molybdotransferase Glp [Microbacterium lemovicicum]AZS37896.1 Molybdopterin molybdenumtransferase 2 [Microbacterium lemovicicum]